MSDRDRGVYRKYEVKRTDGSSEPGGKHAKCAYFVLDLEHDEYAVPALRAYAKACRTTHPALAMDIVQIITTHPCNCRSAGECRHRLYPQTPNEALHETMAMDEALEKEPTP